MIYYARAKEIIIRQNGNNEEPIIFEDRDTEERIMEHQGRVDIYQRN
jgi:hypothetical protein